MHQASRRFVYLGSLGLKGGGSGWSKWRLITERLVPPSGIARPGSNRPSLYPSRVPDSIPERTRSPSPCHQISSASARNQIKELLEKPGIFCTRGLIEALNDWPNKDMKEAMLKEVVFIYQLEFSKLKLTAWRPEQLREFISFSEVQVTTDDGRSTMRRWFSELITKAEDGNGDEHLVDILIHALGPLNPKIFNGDPNPLAKLARILMEKLNLRQTVIVKDISPRQCNILCALCYTLQLVALVHPINWDVSKNIGLFQDLKTTVDGIIEVSAECFPVVHYSNIIKQNILKLRTRDPKMWSRYEANVVCKIARGVANIWNSIQTMLTTKRVDLEGPNKTKNLFSDVNNGLVFRCQQCFDMLHPLNCAAAWIINHPDDYRSFLDRLSKAMKKEKSIKGIDRKHLRHGIMEQLMMVALYARSSEIREQATQELEKMAFSFDESDKPQEQQDILSFKRKCIERIKTENELKTEHLETENKESSIASHGDALFFKAKKAIIETPQNCDLDKRAGDDPAASQNLEIQKSKALRAVLDGQEKVLKQILGEGFPPDSVVDEDEGRLLHMAVEGNLNMLLILLDNKADLEAKDKEERTALHQACMYQHADAVEVLLQRGADVHARTAQRSTPLLITLMENPNEEIMEMLVKYKSDVDAMDKAGYGSLHYCALLGHQRSTELLLKNGADRNKPTSNEDAETPLHIAARESNIAVVRALLDAKANLSAINKEGHKAIDIATSKGHHEIVELLAQSTTSEKGT